MACGSWAHAVHQAARCISDHPDIREVAIMRDDRVLRDIHILDAQSNSWPGGDLGGPSVCRLVRRLPRQAA